MRLHCVSLLRQTPMPSSSTRRLPDAFAARINPARPLPRDQLEMLVQRGYSQRRIASHFGVSQPHTCRELRRHGLTTART